MYPSLLNNIRSICFLISYKWETRRSRIIYYTNKLFNYTFSSQSSLAPVSSYIHLIHFLYCTNGKTVFLKSTHAWCIRYSSFHRPYTYFENNGVLYYKIVSFSKECWTPSTVNLRIFKFFDWHHSICEHSLYKQ